MSDEKDGSQPVNQNYTPEVIKNYRPATLPNQQHPGHGVDGNYIPTTDTIPSSPPPKPKK
ncbi:MULTISPECIES: hypothetical protein [Bradyrhizobium]|jgi:hypothetical protein|uniref:Uncharacterized protein n=1 Tax=Bradyrhizobium elkanii TaxID=29448 RepID=A0A4Y3ZQD1_BRAEL|nr:MULTISPECIES: hypothetical protein [Bradyrhizobium]MBP1290376.1 hypothetical protein [Bradyrhizobium elkanii]MCP1728790.1 hypothetical protein [Bradyrhizobium elkanii]MCP1972147.1 hypothetical protein [Bradyrhizobium elkanii]MCS3452405.1 hypothetical protein [Bradyrhizobium elkanii]MCS3565492.1 hypothetical protein [Bradyrhizobium elkanii]